ncbi:FAD-binding oxidoreductase [Candidatus Magnetominusculus dajiuhuensis]|uniref:FAD-binding oxidoreductase n=1 Tax=Candidatus Magnetominusculus dajiuhuensis TaxID=3137712 RepID=UPI003B438B94
MKSLKDILVDGSFSMDKEDLLCYGYDASGIDMAPAAVVWPKSTMDICKLMQFAWQNDIKVIPRGAGTGLTGGAVPVADSILLSFEKMNNILEIDTRNLNVVVEPGVINGDLQRALGQERYFYPPDPASLNTCTIGGNVAENAGGPRALKYGVTRDYVMQIEAVLPDGKLIQTGVRTKKSVVGYDLTRLLVGSEGTLAVITKIRLKVLPMPESVITILSAFGSLEQAGKAVSRIIADGIIPATMELMDRMTLIAVNKYKNIGFPEDIEAMLLIEIDGNSRAIQADADKVANICNGFQGKVKIAEDPASRELLWEARRAVSPALYKISPTKINEDVVVPVTKVSELLTGLQGISEAHSVPIACFGHAGDGNIHVNIMTDKNDKKKYEEAEKLVRKVFKLTLDLGGSISGEHGIGLTKSKYIDMELNSINLDIMRGIKRLFDTKDILNPGKIFPGTDVH